MLYGIKKKKKDTEKGKKERKKTMKTLSQKDRWKTREKMNRNERSVSDIAWISAWDSYLL